MIDRQRGRALALLVAAGCAADATVAGNGGGSSTGTGTTGIVATTSGGEGPRTTTAASTGDDAPADTTATPTGTATSTGDDSTTGGGLPLDYLCGTPAPEGAELPPAPPEYSGGTCPALQPGWNMLTSLGHAREFIVVVPSDLGEDEQLPLVFLWHWLGGDAEGFLEKADVQNAADQLRFAAVIPAEKGDLLFRWPFTAIDSDARMQEEFGFFDDMLACMVDSYTIDTACVSSTGVSAGALFTDQLGQGRGEYLSSIISLSGGVGGLVKPWNGSPHIMPAMVLWGGPSDFCVAIDFEAGSHNLEAALVEDGHPVLECVHNCGHSEPPFEPPSPELTTYAGMWRFWLDHPYWLTDGESPWNVALPEGTPGWCAMGVGNATPREGECNGAGC